MTPLIDVSQGDSGVMNSPQLYFVPATPVSGGVSAHALVERLNVAAVGGM